jgi:hypothetical protein
MLHTLRRRQEGRKWRRRKGGKREGEGGKEGGIWTLTKQVI